jgi:eukaryotic-like serine/threonine-protein kinase
MLAPSPGARPVTRFSIQAPELVARIFGTGASLAFSPDGRAVVYVVGGTRPGLEKRHLDDASTERIRGTEGGRSPFFSPDGQWIGFFADGQLKKVPVGGGTPVSISDASPTARGAWGDDGTIVVARPDLRKVASSGGTVDVVFEAGNEQFNEPEFLPGSKIVLVQVRQPPNAGHIEAVDLQTRARHRLLEGSSPKLALTGDLIFVRQGRLWATKFDARRLAVVGAPVQLAESVTFTDGTLGEAAFATSNDGSLAYMSGDAVTSLVWLDRTGSATTAVAGIPGLRNPRLSPDGKRVVANGTAAPDLLLFDLDRGSRLRLTTDRYNRGGAWSPDGERIAYFSAAQSPQAGVDTQDLFVMPSSGGTPTRLLERPGPQWADSWSPDGRSLVFDDGPGHSRDLWLLPLGESPRPLVATRFNERSGMVSPVGGLLAFVSDESGSDEIYVQPMPGPGPKVAVSINGGRQPMWSRDGRELFYREGDAMMAVAVQHDPFGASPPRKLFDLPGAKYGLDPYVADYDVAPDGRFISVRRDASPEINVVLNWIEELRRALGR